MLKSARKANNLNKPALARDENTYRSKLNIKINEKETITETATALAARSTIAMGVVAAPDANPPLKSLSLQGNQLCGSILIGNYSQLTQLEVTENEMEVLDLSCLAQLETLKCSNNKLMELMLNGKNLTSIMAANNSLHVLSVSPPPTQLRELDISNNNFRVLPSWLAHSVRLRTLNAQQNQLQTINDFCTHYKIEALHTLKLAYNALRSLPKCLPAAMVSVEVLLLHSNELQQLPENSFAVLQQLRVLNASCNKLSMLPPSTPTCGKQQWLLERVLLSANQLDERIFDVLCSFERLRVLHVAYNKIAELQTVHIRHWSCLEELVLAGNMLQHLPENLSALSRLQVLRVHSNLLLSTPRQLDQLTQLRVLDLAHNHLDRVNILSLMTRSLKYLDLSCNLQLQVDAKQLRECQRQKQWSLVDVSGRNRHCLPTTGLEAASAAAQESAVLLKPPWCAGFAETPGQYRRLLVSQVRWCNYQADESCLYGLLDCTVLPKALASTLGKLLPKILQQERALKDGSTVYLKYTLLAAQRKLLDARSSVAGIALCHIAKECQWSRNFVKPQKTKRYMIRVASMGNVKVYLFRRTSNVCLTPMQPMQNAEVRPPVPCSNVPRILLPDIVELALTNEDEYLVLGNAGVWAVMDADRVAREIRKEENVVLAAKRLQNIAQSFGAEGNLSIIVIRLRNLGTDVDGMIRELKHLARKKPHTTSGYNGALRLNDGQPTRSERSSPSGQSDATQARTTIVKVDGDGQEGSPQHELELLEETDSVLSEEQFKCWEYMLEQNTQLLFDKELNTISKSFTKTQNVLSERSSPPVQTESAGERLEYKSNLLKSINNKFLSTSTPHLLLPSEEKKTSPVPTMLQPYIQNQQHQQPSQQQQKTQVSFLTKYFGSSHSIQAMPALASNFFDARHRRDSLTMLSQPLCTSKHACVVAGGPNAAYFGSLQRLMPYNLEYDFTLTRERPTLGEECEDDELDEADFMEHECRMRKYWGVATTEL